MPQKAESSPKDIVVDHEIHGVTVEMVDWWWDNMDKGYPLWCPDEHKSFQWEVAPRDCPDGHTGAIQVVEESINHGPVMKLRIRWENPKDSPIPIVYTRAMLATGLSPDNKVMTYLLHQYEPTDYGIKMRSTLRPLGDTSPGEAWAKHNKAEVSTFSSFLPELFNLWKNVPKKPVLLIAPLEDKDRVETKK
jgi:hypothetical protein